MEIYGVSKLCEFKKAHLFSSYRAAMAEWLRVGFEIKIGDSCAGVNPAQNDLYVLFCLLPISSNE